MEKLKDTRLLEISATLPDAKHAQELAQYIAEETVALSRNLSREGDLKLVAGPGGATGDGPRGAGPWPRTEAASVVQPPGADRRGSARDLSQLRATHAAATGRSHVRRARELRPLRKLP